MLIDVEVENEELSSDNKQKKLAKNLAEVSTEAVIVAFSPKVIYYTGLSNLFQKPEFSEFGLIINISTLFDHFEDVVDEFYAQVGEEPKYFIGEEHNLGEMLSVLAVRFGKNFESKYL
jgi:transcriptional regulator of heat shock response